MTEFEDEYSAALGSEFRELKGALLSDTIHTLEPAEPLCIPETATVHDTVVQMVARRQPGVLIVNQEGRLVGIFTERDVLTRVVGPGVAGPGLDVHRTPISQVMTRDPEALALQDRVCYAVNRMSVAGYRTIPLVDAERRPIGIVTVTNIIKWLAHIFPEAILNLPPGDTIKRPHQVDAG